MNVLGPFIGYYFLSGGVFFSLFLPFVWGFFFFVGEKR